MPPTPCAYSNWNETIGWHVCFCLPLFFVSLSPSLSSSSFSPRFFHRVPGGLNLVILLPQSPQCWGYRCAHFIGILSLCSINIQWSFCLRSTFNPSVHIYQGISQSFASLIVIGCDYVKRETFAITVLAVFSLMASFTTQDAEGKFRGIPFVGRVWLTYPVLIAPRDSWANLERIISMLGCSSVLSSYLDWLCG